MFAAQIVGNSMEPVIPDGSYCLFRAPVEGTRQVRLCSSNFEIANTGSNIGQLVS